MELKIKGKGNNKVNIDKPSNSEEVAIRLKETEAYKTLKLGSKKNINTIKRILANIEVLNGIQQKYVQKAKEMGFSYMPLINVALIKSEADILKNQLFEIDRKIDETCNQKDFNKIKCDFAIISKTNIGISTLLKCLNDSKNSIISNKHSRFPEMIEIEGIELKRIITIGVKRVLGEAELKKLKDDLKIIQDRGTFRKFIGILTGRNKIDSCLEMQIRYRKTAIENTLKQNLTISQNYNIEEVIAEILMFIEDNKNDELVKEEVAYLKALYENLKENYFILDSKVQNIIIERDGKNLLYSNKKM